MVIFLDTFAIIEIYSGNENYSQYTLEPTETICTIFNLMEVHFYYLKNFGKEEADKIYEIVKPMVVVVTDEMAKEANKFKIENQKKRFSFADCVGYNTALKLKAKFVTGDYAFKDFENVEFVR